MTLGLAENIAAKRIELGLTQQQLADKVGVSRVSVLRWKEDTVSPSIYAVWDLADFFECSIDELCGRVI